MPIDYMFMTFMTYTYNSFDYGQTDVDFVWIIND